MIPKKTYRILFLILFIISFSSYAQELKIFDKSKVCDGYILWQDKMKCQLMDRDGKVLYNFPGNLCAFYPDKNEIVAHVGGSLVDYNKDLDVIWRNNIYVDHDVIVTPDNRIMIYSVDYDTINNLNIRFDNIYYFDENGKQLYKWSTLDQYRYLFTYMIEKTNVFKFKTRTKNPDSVLVQISKSLTGITANVNDRELFHMNAFQVIPSNKSEKKDTIFKKGNLLLSFCNYNDSILSFVAVADPVNYKILWHYVQKDGKQIHTPTLLENGNILMYVNSSCKRSIDSSSVIEIDPFTKQVVWEYVEHFPDPQPRCSHGSCQRLPNGNTLISNISGYIYEVTPDKKIVWQWYTSGTKHLYRAYLYPKEKLNWLLNDE
jgi:hypothetical protein